MKQCPRCFSEISELDEICPRCGMRIDKSVKSDYKKSLKKERKRLKAEKKRAKKEERRLLEEKETNFDDFKAVDYMTKKQEEKSLKYEKDGDGKIFIDTKDVELIDEEELYNYNQRQTYSIKKARGEYYAEKVKWWEIYKRANRALARRKIKKEVNKAAKIKPDYISKRKLLLLAIFFGWFSAQNFYAKNYKKAWTTLICCILWIGVISLAKTVSFFASIELSIGGGAGFVVLLIWIADIINIITNTFKYRTQKIAFISKMNIETRAKLGNKYIDMDLYKKPFFVRFKHWIISKRKDFDEYKQKRRQKLIEKEKELAKKQAENEDLNKQIADYEKFEAEQANKIKKDNEILKDVAELKKDIYNDENTAKKFASSKKPKISIKSKKKK